jgi:hypothetical protein
MTASTVSGNLSRGGDSVNARAGGQALGGGLYLLIFSASQTELSDSTISGNTARGGNAGGNYTHIYTRGGHAAGGGAYHSGGILIGSQLTIHGNSAVGGAHSIPTQAGGSSGGAIFSARTNLSLRHTTVAGNVSANVPGFGRAGGIDRLGGTITLTHAIVADNMATTRPDIGEPITATFSLIETPAGVAVTGSNNKTGVDPLLGPLADNGGPTLTRPLLAGSPALNAGDPTAVAGGGGVPLNDQRRAPFGRVFDGRIDIGAVEVRPIPVADFEFDLDVDGGDFLAWQRGFGVAPPNGTKALGDADGDLDVDGGDFAAWKSQFGAAPSAASLVARLNAAPSYPSMTEAALTATSSSQPASSRVRQQRVQAPPPLEARLASTDERWRAVDIAFDALGSRLSSGRRAVGYALASGEEPNSVEVLDDAGTLYGRGMMS